MRLEEIKSLVKLISEHELTEFKLETEEFNLSIRRGGAPAAAPAVSMTAAPAPAAAAAPSAPALAMPAAGAAAPAPAATPTATIKSPLVGTFYRSNSPEGESFVKVGDKVTPETIVCIIEAMKVMNEVKAECSGIVKDILAENGSPVEYGQALFVVE
ncbi:MAG: acetyl-CoA carboxylase biotin carboxyl carrier protein [Victivallaceae bacterium]|nr:acetyl-CoA carboxylase biotin carboxyl carrier protein [Victivallaceae bacterium]